MKNPDLQRKFLQFIQKENLVGKNDKILLAVSGGVDSMVMLHLFRIAKIQIEIAHCNFSLRGSASDADEQLVKQYALENHIPFHSKHFQTETIAKKEKISIQQAARNLRYKWFSELMKANKAAKLATAHHLDDNIETFFINLNRGAGLKGLKGIPIKTENIIRPLILFSKEELYSHAHSHNLPFREDESNKDSKYLRNWFRNKLLPKWEEKNPQFKKSMKGNLHLLYRQYKLYEKWMNSESKEIRDQLKSSKISIDGIKKLSDPPVSLYELLEPYGFTFPDMEQLCQILDEQKVGKKIIADEYTLFVDRQQIILKRNYQIEETELIIRSPEEAQQLPFIVQLKSYKKNSVLCFNPSENTLQADAGKIEFPLIVRNWQKGDSFQPLGMKGMKKVSDFLIDEKISLAEKSEIKVMLSADRIIWIIGKRMDERVKIDEQTENILEIEVEQI